MDLQYTMYVGAQPDEVWRVLTSEEGTRLTFFGCVIESTFQVGDPIAYVGPGNDGDRTVHVYGKVLAYEPGRTFSMTEHAGPSYNPEHERFETRITFTLEPVGECTKLTLVNDLWPENHPSYANTKEHWPMILSNIKTVAETGKALNFGW